MIFRGPESFQYLSRKLAGWFAPVDDHVLAIEANFFEVFGGRDVFRRRRVEARQPFGIDVVLAVLCAKTRSGTMPRLMADPSSTPPYICAVPPSTNSSTPVTKLESSDARKSAALAIS